MEWGLGSTGEQFRGAEASPLCSPLLTQKRRRFLRDYSVAGQLVATQWYFVPSEHVNHWTSGPKLF